MRRTRQICHENERIKYGNFLWHRCLLPSPFSRFLSLFFLRFLLPTNATVKSVEKFRSAEVFVSSFRCQRDGENFRVQQKRGEMRRVLGMSSRISIINSISILKFSCLYKVQQGIQDCTVFTLKSHAHPNAIHIVIVLRLTLPSHMATENTVTARLVALFVALPRAERKTCGYLGIFSYCKGHKKRE